MYEDSVIAQRSQSEFAVRIRFQSQRSYVTIARIDQDGEKGSGFPVSGATSGNHFAVAGMNWARPRAPTADTARSFHRDS